LEDLPYIDEGVRKIDVSPEQVWRALVGMLGSLGRGLPRALVAVWGLEPSRRTGDWRSGPAVGDTIVGFGVVQVQPLRELVLRGGHRFARYELRFEITDADDRSAVLHAHTSAVFPGPDGAIYRALVIGSRGHQLAVGAMLARVARRAATIHE
jgi:hypothetical protein